MSAIQWLMEWYENNCDDDWEHSYGVTIRSLDDESAWLVEIDLSYTDLAEKKFKDIDHHFGQDWINCSVISTMRGRKFIGKGDSGKLEEVLEVFRTWANS